MRPVIVRPQGTDRRGHRRQNVSFSCAEFGKNNSGMVLNVSVGGLAVAAIGEVIDDELPNLRFQCSGMPARIEAKGRVAWRRDSNKMIGIEFIDLPDEARKQIQSWISFVTDATQLDKIPTPLAEIRHITRQDQFEDSIARRLETIAERHEASVIAKRLGLLALATAFLLLASFLFGHYLQKVRIRQQIGEPRVVEPK